MGDPDSPPRNPGSVSPRTGVLAGEKHYSLSLAWLGPQTYLGVQSVSEDNKGIEGSVAGQPDLLERAVLHEDSLQVRLPALLVQVWQGDS